MLHDLIPALPALGFIGLGVAGLALFGRDPRADEHDLADYHEPDRHPWLAARVTYAEPCTIGGGSCRCNGGASCEIPQWERDVLAATPGDILPPAPPGMNAGSPLYAETLFASWRQGETPAETAARFLREIGDQAKAKTADRDLTGAFPWVRAA